jgi:hypothetical protein
MKSRHKAIARRRLRTNALVRALDVIQAPKRAPEPCVMNTRSLDALDGGPAAIPFQSLDLDASTLIPPLRALWRTVGGDQTGFPDHRLGLGSGNAQAGSFEIRPGLLRAARTYAVDIQPVTLGEGMWHAGFDLRGKTGKNGEGGGDKRSNHDCCKSLDHDGPLSLGLFGPSFGWLTDTQRRFQNVFARCKNGFVAPEFCFVAHSGRNKAGLHRRRAGPLTGSVADEI